MKRTWIGLLVLVLWVDSQALAQSDTVIVSDSKIEVLRPPDVEAQIAALDRAYDEVSLRGPKAGLAISHLLLAGGAFTIGTGAAFHSPGQHDTQAMLAAGAAAIAAGLTGLIVSAIRLKKKKAEKRKLRRQRITLELASGSTTGASSVR